ncbi:MAG: Stk1 family PASTA domain-containing Ser/Thr kinase [Clostridia bacterium]|nr:Stk1 family PASTA domain-containing Ser/Thr kinase [Clostridia bacterium]
MESYVGKRLDGRYEIREIIGVGGMAVVYKAYDIIDDRIVAVKVLKDEYLANEEFRRRFKNESKAIAVLSHPNIVRVFDVSYGDKLQYIVMEYVEGITLKEYIEQQEVINQKEAVYFVMQILRALQHAHDKGVVHRDIKPQNIMLLENGTIRVTDFGIARFSRSETRTLSDSTIGSVHYISPEQARGDVTDDRADLYSVGVMFYEMLTGKLPFVADSSVSVAIMQLQNDPELPTKVNPDIPVGLEQIIMRAMKKNVNERYQSAAEMILDLEEFKRNPSIRFNYSFFVDTEPTKPIKKAPVSKAPVKIEDEEDEEEEVVKNRTIPVLVGIIAALVVAIGVLSVAAVHFGWVDIGLFSKTEVPKFVGMNYYNEIDGVYEDFNFAEPLVTNDDSKAPGTVITQTPEAGTKIDADKTVIQLTIAVSSEQIAIPDNLVGNDYAYVVSQLEGLGFTVKPRKVELAGIDPGTVVKVSPSSGAMATVGDVVTVEYNAYEGEEIEYVTVKDVTGLKTADAKTLLASLNLDVKVEEVFDETIPVGIVTAQSVADKAKVPEGTEVIIYVSKGPDPSVTTTVKFRLPLSGDFRKVEVLLNGEVIKTDENVLMIGIDYSVEVKGYGANDKLEAYIDNQLYYECSINFTSASPNIYNETTHILQQPTEPVEDPTEPSSTEPSSEYTGV